MFPAVHKIRKQFPIFKQIFTAFKRILYRRKTFYRLNPKVAASSRKVQLLCIKVVLNHLVEHAVRFRRIAAGKQR